MKLFRQKDELFELMGKAADRRRGTTADDTKPKVPSPSTSTSGPRTLERTVKISPTTPKPTPTAFPQSTRPSAASAASIASIASAASTRSSAASTRSSASASSSASSSSSTSTSAPVTSTGTRRLPKSPPGFGGPPSPEEDMFEIDGDALVVVDDGWEEANPIAAGSTFAIRADTAIVGGLLAGGLLITAFFVGRTTTAPDAPAERPIAPVVIVQKPQEESSPASSVAASAASAPTSAPRTSGTPGPIALSAGARPGLANALAAGFQSSPPGQSESQSSTAPQTPSPPVAPPTTPKGKYELRVCTTTPDKAAAVAQWLNETPRSPIFGRGDLKAVVTNGGGVRIQGFAQREADVLARVRATSDPTNGGSGTFHDALYTPVRN